MPRAELDITNTIDESAYPLSGRAADYDGLLRLIGQGSLCLLGEASHGTHEFYRERAEITKRLIQQKNFTAVAVEGDWPDAFRVNRYVRRLSDDRNADEALADSSAFQPAIGVIYLPQTERQSHYFDARLWQQFDAVIHLDETRAVENNINRNTFAYPTTLTDANGFSSTVKYNFDFGGRTRTQGPPPAGQSQGAIQTVTYDSIGRVERTTTVINGAYTRYVYGTYYIQSFATVNNVADQAYAIQTFDGVGRVVGAASNHPGSTGGYKAQNTIYDLMGRAVKTSNPSEINSGWVPTGHDAAGWLYSQQTYDWQGRPLRTTHPDGNVLPLANLQR